VKLSSFFLLIKEKVFLLTKYFLSLLFFAVPINKNKICFSSFYGKGISSDPKYVCDCLIDKGLKIVWASINSSKISDKKVAYLNPNSIKWLYHKMTSSVWVDNCRTDMFFKRRKTLYINTWHGGSLQKKIERDALNLSNGYIKKAKRDSKLADYYLSNSEEFTSILKKSFWYSNDILAITSPRNDALIKMRSNSTTVSDIKKRLGLSPDTIIILYCPTFRDKTAQNIESIDFDSLRKVLNGIKEANYAFLFRLHPNVLTTNYVSCFSNAIDVTKYDDIQELLAVSDILISDYSSVLYDYSFTDGIAIRYIPDLDSYRDERGFYHDINFYPWPIARSNSEMQQLLKQFDKKKYFTNVNKYLINTKQYSTRNPSSIISNIILDYINNNLSKKLLKEKIKEYIA